MSSKSNVQQAMQAVQQEAALANAKTLVDSINRSCFEKCVPSPGTSLSSKEQQCFTSCMEKYMNTWNSVSRAYVQRLQQEQGQKNAFGALGQSLE
ncbi:MAG: protein translocase subunit [Chrysothrix sp. TS-e1954]|nr:MAG: protein translocase subunit [Chrysothrix sp. TS-e1954]